MAKATITVSKARTINMGNYESKRVDIGLALECDESAVDETFARIREWVDRKLAKEVG